MKPAPQKLNWSLRRIWGRSSLLGRAFLVVCVLLTATRCRQVSAASSSDSDGSDGTITMSDEKRLIKKLLDNYETVGVVGRPVYNVSQTISVSYGLSLIQILDLDEKNQVLTTNVWSRYNEAAVRLLRGGSGEDLKLAGDWFRAKQMKIVVLPQERESAVFLMWDPKDYGGVIEVRVPSSKIWTPDIVLYNIADIRLKEQRDAMVIIDHHGQVIWIPPAIFKSTCPIDITNFPFDIQVCKMKFGSWTYDGFKLDINFYENKNYVETTEYMASNEWALIEHPAIKNILHYDGFMEPYLDLTFFLKIKRVAAFYNYIVVLPCVLLSFLTLVIFWLPPESPAKVMLGMSVFVAFFVLLLLLAESIPPAATDIPLIGAYFCVNMILITLSTFLAVIIIQTHIRGDRKNKVPPWLKRVAIDGMARILCMGEFLEKESSSSSAAASKASDGRHSEETSSLHQKHASSSSSTSTAAAAVSSKDKRSCRATNTSEANFNRIQPSPGGGARDGSAPPPGEYNATNAAAEQSSLHNPILENDIKEIRRILKNYMGRLDSKDATAKTAKEWRLVARVLDRLFFYTYIGTILISWCIFFPRDNWKDIMLQWDPDNYDGISQVRVPVGKIWKPDIVLYNYADQRLKEHRDAMAVVEWNGMVLWMPAAIFKSTCSIDILYFPFDVQSCDLKFGSWTYDGFKLDLNFYLNKNEIDVSNYVGSNEWLLLSYPGRKNAKTYPCCPEPYYDITFTINIKRIPIFYTFTLIIPCILLSLLTLVSFWLPPETPAKILLGMNLFLAFFLLLKLLSSSTPASSSIPLIGAYFCLNMVLITLSSFISATVINLYRRDDKKNKVPGWVKKVVIDGLSRVLFMEQRKSVVRKKTRRDHVTHHVTHVIDGTTEGRKSHHEKTIKSPVLPYNKWEAQPRAHGDSPIASHGHCYFQERADQSCVVGGVVEAEVKEIKRVLKNFMNKLQTRDAKERMAMEWRLVALTIDRMFFALYVLTIVVSTLTIYLMCFMYYESTEHLDRHEPDEENGQDGQ